MPDISLDIEKTLNKILTQYNSDEGNTISLLQDIQEEFGYIPEETVDWFSQKLDLPESHLFGVATFYSQFHLQPRGKNIVSICCGTACHVKGGTKIAERIKLDLGLTNEQDTTKDGIFTLEEVRCVGACSIAPVVLVNDRVHQNMTVMRTARLIKNMKKEESGEEK
jgi:NADH:ubiquinone oxidoreductase subunit E